MSNKRLSKNVFNDIGKHCQLLVDDFFHFCDGEADRVTIITELRDISEQMPPNLEQLRKMFARCDRAWKDYCKFMRLPGESEKMFVNRVKTRWVSLEEQRRVICKREGKNVEGHHR